MKRLVLPIVLAALLAGAAVYLYQSSREGAPAAGSGVLGVPVTGETANRKPEHDVPKDLVELLATAIPTYDKDLSVREVALAAILASACAPVLGYTQTHTRPHPLGDARTCVRADLPNRTIAHIA